MAFQINCQGNCEIIVHRLSSTFLIPIVWWIEAYISGRVLRLHVGGGLLQTIPQRGGAPQDSVNDLSGARDAWTRMMSYGLYAGHRNSFSSIPRYRVRLVQQMGHTHQLCEPL